MKVQDAKTRIKLMFCLQECSYSQKGQVLKCELQRRKRCFYIVELEPRLESLATCRSSVPTGSIAPLGVHQPYSHTCMNGA